MHAIPLQYRDCLLSFINQTKKSVPRMDDFQSIFCMTTETRTKQKYLGPFELLESIKEFIETNLSPEEQKKYINISNNPKTIPLAIAVGYIILKRILAFMGRNM